MGLLRRLQTNELELQYFEFLKTKRAGKLTSAEEKSYENSLLKRSKLGPREDEFEFTSGNPPHNSLNTWRFGLGLNQDKIAAGSLILSPATHRLLQRENGYLPNSEITLLELIINSQKANTYYLNELTIFSLKNFTPITLIDPKYSWTIKTQVSRDRICDDCYYSISELNIGLSYLISNQLVYSLIGASDYKDLVFHPQLILGTILKYGLLKANLQFRHIEPINRFYEKLDLISFSTIIPLSQNFDIELNSESKLGSINSSIILNHYY